jgi:hypothetical protein
MNNSDTIAMIAILPLTIIFWAWVVWAILEWRKMRHKSQLQNKIVEKFADVREFSEFIQSKEGNKFLDFLKFNGQAPKQKILSSLAKGVIISFIGISLVLIGQIFPDEMRYFLAFGIVVIALGAGFLVSTLISYTLSKRWGIMDGD